MNDDDDEKHVYKLKILALKDGYGNACWNP